MSNYSKQWSSASPGCLIFLVDQSNSMGQEWQGGKTFSQFTAEIINRTINELIATNAAGETVKNRVFIALIGYGNGVKEIRSGYLNDFAEKPERIETVSKPVKDRTGNIVTLTVEMPIFLEPISANFTPMGTAFETAEKLIQRWIEKKNDNPVPIIINVSDGHPEGASLQETMQEKEKTISTAKRIMSIQTLDGNPLIFNVHIGKERKEIQFPQYSYELEGDPMAELLFNISSMVPAVYKKAAKDLELQNIGENSKGFISNASPETLLKFINFGSSGGVNRATV